MTSPTIFASSTQRIFGSSLERGIHVSRTYPNLGQQLLDVVRTGGLDYRLHGTVSLTGALALTLPFNRTGRLDLLTTGQELLADAAAPTGTRCAAPHVL